MNKAKQKLSGGCGVRVRVYELLADCVEDGIERGWNRAHKHTDDPDQIYIFDSQHNAIMGAICERFSFPGDDE